MASGRAQRRTGTASRVPAQRVAVCMRMRPRQRRAEATVSELREALSMAQVRVRGRGRGRVRVGSEHGTGGQTLLRRHGCTRYGLIPYGMRHGERTGRLYLPWLYLPWLYLPWQTAWREERQQRAALEEALAGSLGEVGQRPVA